MAKNGNERRSLSERALAAVERAATILLPKLLWPVPTDSLIRFGGWLGRRLPNLSAARRIENNLDLVRPDMPRAERDAVIRGVGDNFTRVLIEYQRMKDVVPRTDRRTVSSGAEVVRAAIAGGKGAIFLTAHYGNWEICRLAARDLGLETGILYRAFNNDLFDEISFELIRMCGEPVLHKGRKGMSQLVRHVMKGGAITVLIDQRNTGAPLIPFMGQPAETAVALAELSARAGAPLIPTRARRLADGLSFDVRFEEPIPPGDPLEMMAEMNRRIEGWIDEDPGQWFWLHRRWRRKADPIEADAPEEDEADEEAET